MTISRDPSARDELAIVVVLARRLRKRPFDAAAHHALAVIRGEIAALRPSPPPTSTC